MFRRLFWLSVLVGLVYLIWRWARQQGEAPTPAATARLYTPPAPATPPASETVASGAPTGRRPIPTRVHRGAPPPPPRPSGAPDDPAAEPPSAALTAEAAAPAEPGQEPAGNTGPDLAPPAAGGEDGARPWPAPTAAEQALPEALGGVDLAEARALAAPAGLTNVNTADEEALIALPGIGPALARRIIAHREANGPFASVDQLEVIQGIGPRNIAEFRHLVTV